MSTGHSYLAFVYDEMVRKSWSSRVSSGDLVDFDVETVLRDKTMLELARARLELVLQHAGLGTESRYERRSPNSNQPAHQVNAEGALAKQQAAAEALKRKAENSSRELARQQLDMENRQQALFQNQGYDGSDQKRQKRQGWLDKMHVWRNDDKRNGKGTRGKNGNGGNASGSNGKGGGKQTWYPGQGRVNKGKGKGTW